MNQPVYLNALRESRLRSAAQRAKAALADCALCPRRCHVDRLAGELGFCGTGERAWVASYNAHFGEEAPLVGKNGSGTIFFCHCNLMCTFCQNYDISRRASGVAVDDRQLADIMLELQSMGCHNINFVTPSHVVPQILGALILAAEEGLNVPLVFNSGGYDSLETLKLLDGVIDIYMPDFKFWDTAIAQQTCQAPDYPRVACAAVSEMHRQVGDLIISGNGLAQRGLLVRHLVLPHGLAGTEAIMHFIASRISVDTYVNIMPQYRPCGRAREIPALSEPLSTHDYQQALKQAHAAGITRLDKRRRTFGLW
jgi:putative pyruvate formate lyase activating enzyme